MSHEEINFVDEMEKDDAWLKAHLEEIVDRYAHKVIAILDQEIVWVGESISGVQQQIVKQYPARVPLVFEVPSREEFTCLLSSTNTRS
jgi:ABC-type phosphate/phosphonate transport system ATPase subunit